MWEARYLENMQEKREEDVKEILKEIEQERDERIICKVLVSSAFPILQK